MKLAVSVFIFAFLVGVCQSEDKSVEDRYIVAGYPAPQQQIPPRIVTGGFVPANAPGAVDTSNWVNGWASPASVLFSSRPYMIGWHGRFQNQPQQ